MSLTIVNVSMLSVSPLTKSYVKTPLVQQFWTPVGTQFPSTVTNKATVTNLLPWNSSHTKQHWSHHVLNIVSIPKNLGTQFSLNKQQRSPPRLQSSAETVIFPFLQLKWVTRTMVCVIEQYDMLIPNLVSTSCNVRDWVVTLTNCPRW